MREERLGTMLLQEPNNKSSGLVQQRRPTFGAFLRSEPTLSPQDLYDLSSSSSSAEHHRVSNASPATSPLHYAGSPTSDGTATTMTTPYLLSPLWDQPSPFTKSPWIIPSPSFLENYSRNWLIGSLVRKEGHVYSLAASGGLLYTGSDSKNIRVWKNLREFSGFKSNSGLVKAIVVSGDRVFTGHQDGKIRVWKKPSGSHMKYEVVASVHKRIGSLPTLKDFIKKSINPKNYVQVRRHSKALRIKHFDAVSCMSLDKEQGVLYSGSWDKTVKVWRLSDSKCLESVNAHDDAINTVVSGFDGLVFTGSADGTVKLWRREMHGNGTKHFLVQVLLEQESAVTSLAVSESAVIYAGSSDGALNFWEREKHLSHGGVLRGHKLAVLCLAVAGNLVLSGSADKTVCVWRREVTGAHAWLSVLTGHGGPIKCLAVEAERTVDRDEEEEEEADRRWVVYSGSLDKSVRVWRVSEQEPEMRIPASPWHALAGVV